MSASWSCRSWLSESRGWCLAASYGCPVAPTSDPGPTRLAGDPLPRDGGRVSLRALAAVESRQLIFHPLVLASVPLTGLFAVAAAGNPDEDFLSYKFVVGGTLLFYATAVMLAASSAALRSHRSGTDELFGTMPVQAPARTVALFAALGPAVVVAVVAQAVLILAVGSWDGLGARTVQASEIVLKPGAAALLQGPVFVAFSGVLGIALARWSTSVFPAYLIVGLVNFVVWPALLWWQWGWQRFLLPVAHDLRTSGSVDLGAGRSALRVLGSTPEALGWHVAYLAGWAALLAGAALLREARRREAILVALGGLSTAVVAGVMQVTAWRA